MMLGQVSRTWHSAETGLVIMAAAYNEGRLEGLIKQLTV